MQDFSQAELDRLCLPPGERLREVLEEGSPSDVLACFARMVSVIRDIANLYAAWSVCTVGWLNERHGLSAAAAAVSVHELWPAGEATLLDVEQLALVRSVLRDVDDAVTRRLTEVAKARDEAGLLALWSQVHEACECAETLRRDAVTAQLTLVNDRYGAAGLEDCLRYSADLVWAPRMARDLACPPTERLRNWAEKLAVGHNGAVRIREHPDRWTCILDPCGSCGRQILAGRYAPPWNFGVVADGAAVGFLRPDITVYQAHLAVAHTLVPIERTGAPWPAVSCAGLSAGPCELVLYSDPTATDESYYAQVGARRP